MSLHDLSGSQARPRLLIVINDAFGNRSPSCSITACPAQVVFPDRCPQLSVFISAQKDPPPPPPPPLPTPPQGPPPPPP